MTNLSNPSFENGWTDIQLGADYGWLQNQQPNDWHLRWIDIGDSLFGTDEAHGVPECVHKLTEQLPPNEQPGGSDPLILDGEHVYKVFHNGASFGVELWQIVEGLESGTTAKIIVPVRIHAHGEKDNPDTYAAESGVWLLDDWTVQGDLLAPLNGAGDWVPLTRERQWEYIGGVKPDGWQWYYHEVEITVPPSGAVCVLVRVKSKWDKPVDFFIDDLQFEAEGGTEPPPIEPPPNDLEERVTALELRVLQLESEAHTHDTEPPIEPPPNTSGLGMDVSHWNGPIDWDVTKESGIEYAFIKATEGASFVDSRFGENWGESNRAGVPRSAYHYFRFGIDATSQANHFWSVVGELGDIPHVVDVEDTKQPADKDALKIFIDRLIVLSGSKPIIYTGAWFWNDTRWGGAVEWASDYLLWVADYRDVINPKIPTDWDTWHIWQYTSKGDGPTYGASGDNLDLNRTNEDKPTEPPTGQTVDMLPYFTPAGKHGIQVVFKFEDGRTQPQQMEAIGEQTILWKGEGQQIDGKMVFDYEQLIANGAGIQKGTDTSSGGATAYNLGWVEWLPRYATIGKVYISRPTVKTFNRVTCQAKSSIQTTDYIYFREVLKVWTSPYDESIKFYDVAVFEWRKTPDFLTPPIEVYKLARNVMYCEWNDGAIAEVPDGREPLSFELTDCVA